MANVDIDGNKQPKGVHAGVNSAWQRVSLSATTSVGDVLRVIKLPHGAVLDEVVVYTGTAFAAQIIAVGIETDSDRFASATFSAAAVRMTSGLGPNNQISLSDDADVRYEYLTITPAAALTVGEQFVVNARYNLDHVA